MKRKRRGRILSVVLSATLLVSLLVGCDGSKTAATTMRLIRFLGDVTLMDDGAAASLMENMSLHSGNVIKTGSESEADLALDDTKFVGLDPGSEAQFYQEGKKLDIKFNAGGLYFYTTEKLRDDEEMNVETSTMVVGIRGTSGHFDVDPKTGETRLYLTSGEVDVNRIDENGEVIGTAHLSPGEMVSITGFDTPSEGEQVSGNGLSVNGYEPEDLPISYLKKMDEDSALMSEVVNKGGFDETMMTTLATTAAAGGSAAEVRAAAEKVRTAEDAASAESVAMADDLAETERDSLTAHADTEAAGGAGDTTPTPTRTATTNPTPAPAATEQPAAEQTADEDTSSDNRKKDDSDDSDSRSKKKTESSDEEDDDDADSSSNTSNTGTTDAALLQAYLAAISSGSSSSSGGSSSGGSSSGESSSDSGSSDSGSSDKDSGGSTDGGSSSEPEPITINISNVDNISVESNEGVYSVHIGDKVVSATSNGDNSLSLVGIPLVVYEYKEDEMSVTGIRTNVVFNSQSIPLYLYEDPSIKFDGPVAAETGETTTYVANIGTVDDTTWKLRYYYSEDGGSWLLEW